jgi:hypothetical protein
MTTTKSINTSVRTEGNRVRAVRPTKAASISRHADALDVADQSEISHGRKSDQGDRKERGWLVRYLFRSECTSGQGEQLAADGSEQELVRDSAYVRATGALAQQDLAAE